jgi:hypothetical protein
LTPRPLARQDGSSWLLISAGGQVNHSYAAEEAHLKRRVFQTAGAVSLLLSLSLTVLWVRSYRWRDVLSRVSLHPTQRLYEDHRVYLVSQRGTLWVEWDRSSYQPSQGEPWPQVSEWLVISDWQSERDAPAIDPNLPMTRCLGFGWTVSWHRVGHQYVENGVGPYVLVEVPHWSIVVLTAILPIWQLVAFTKRRRARRSDLIICANCGYDVRATPNRCPECGAVAQPPHNQPMQRTATASTVVVK